MASARSATVLVTILALSPPIGLREEFLAHFPARARAIGEEPTDLMTAVVAKLEEAVKPLSEPEEAVLADQVEELADVVRVSQRRSGRALTQGLD